MRTLLDIWAYMKEKRKWWLFPTIIVLLVLGLLVVFAGGSAVAPFIYTIF